MFESEKLVELLKSKNYVIVFVESCTGGALADAITDIVGASQVLKDSFVTYSNEAKVKLGVSKYIIDQYSVYSSECAKYMAYAGIQQSVAANICVSVTGTLNRVDPDNSENSLPGEVYFHILEHDYKEEGFKVNVNKNLNRSSAKAFLTDFILSKVNEFLKED